MNKNHWKSECLKWWYHRWILLSLVVLELLISIFVLVLNTPSPAPNVASEFAPNASPSVTQSASPSATLNTAPSAALGVGQTMETEKDVTFVSNQLLQSFYLGQVGFVILAALYFGQEWSGRSLRTSLLCVPNRGKWLLAKIANLILWQTVTLILYTAVTMLTLRVFRGIPMSPENVLHWVIILLPVYASAIQLSLITSGLVLASGSMVVSLAVMVSMILGLGQVLLQFGAWARVLPVLSVMNAFSTTEISLYPGVGVGLLMQSGWCIVVLGVGYFALRRKSVR